MNLSRLNEALENRSELPVRNRILLDSIDSTNSLGRRIVRLFLERDSQPPRTLVITRRQSAGRGRLERNWVSVPDRGAYLSLVAPMEGPDDLASLPLLVGVGLCQKISEMCNSGCRLKWPNDLMVSGRKLGGILIECVSRGASRSAAVIGIGVNYADSEAIAAVGGIALREVSNRLPSLSEVIVELVVAVEEELTHIGDMAYAVDRYREWSVHRKGDTLQFRTEDGLQSGIFSTLDERGFLVLQSTRGEVRLGSGEIIEEWTGRKQ